MISDEEMTKTQSCSTQIDLKLSSLFFYLKSFKVSNMHYNIHQSECKRNVLSYKWFWNIVVRKQCARLIVWLAPWRALAGGLLWSLSTISSVLQILKNIYTGGLYKYATIISINIYIDAPVRLGAAGWLGWPALSQKHYSHKPASSTSLSHKRTSNDTNQPTEQAVSFQLSLCRELYVESS